MLAKADSQFGGVWRAQTITGDAALEILVPSHAGEPCKGDQLTLVGDTGTTVREAAATLTRLGPAYARNNPSCAERISFATDAPFTQIVLCTAPLDWEEYARVTPIAGAYYCIDGFHRLIGWAAAGRLDKSAEIAIWSVG